jgi:Ca2+:H+ antiporter
MPNLKRRTVLLYGGYLVAFLAIAAAELLGLPALVRFALAVVALAGGALAVNDATERLSQHLGPASTGIVQSALGNLPELFLSYFALQAGLLGVVAAALVGSVLGNSLFVLGIAVVAGGAIHERLTFSASANRLYATELMLGVAALVVPFLATQPGALDYGHERELSAVVAVVLLGLFGASIVLSMGHGGSGPGARPPVDRPAGAEPASVERAERPLWPTLVALGLTAAASAFVADWFVEALKPTMADFGMSQEFAGLIVVALAGNAVENVAGVSAAARGDGDLSMSLILNSALQVVLFLAPVIVLASFVVAPTPLTLIFSPLLLGALALGTVLVALIVTDGEANAFEGAMLVGLYLIVAAAVWWGPPIAT